MKTLARTTVWFPGMDRMIENRVRSCELCAVAGSAPVKVPLHQWEEPENPWQRIHIDFCGPMYGAMWLVVVDAKSKWPEVVRMTKTITSDTVKSLHGIFRTFGIPEQIVSDNGPQFASADFENFCEMHGIRHVRTAPYHPQSNGEAERFVQTGVDQNLERSDGEEALNTLLLDYRLMPHAATGKSPAEVMFGRQIRTKFTMTGELNSLSYRAGMKERFDQHTRFREYQPGDLVWVLSYRISDDKWIPGVVLHKVGRVMCLVQTHHGTEKRHFNQMKTRVPWDERSYPLTDVALPNSDTSNSSNSGPSQARSDPDIPEMRHSTTRDTDQSTAHSDESQRSPRIPIDSPRIPTPSLRRQHPQRQRRPPVRYSPEPRPVRATHRRN